MVTYLMYIPSQMFKYDHILRVHTLRWVRYVIYDAIYMCE